jgi:hypothetical protein
MGAFTEDQVDLREEPAILPAPVFVLRKKVDVLAVESHHMTNSKSAGCDNLPTSPVPPMRMQNVCSAHPGKANQMILVGAIQ